MVLPAMVYKSDPRETMAHFRAVARPSDLPIMCYNNPVSYGVDITPEMFAELADEPKFVAIKESSENVRARSPTSRIAAATATCCSAASTTGAGEHDARRRRLGVGPGQRLPGREPAAVGPGDGRAATTRRVEVYRWYTPLLHLDTHVKLVQYIKLAGRSAASAPKWSARRGCRWSSQSARRFWRSSARRSKRDRPDATMPTCRHRRRRPAAPHLSTSRPSPSSTAHAK